MINSKAKGRSIIDLKVNSLVDFKIYSVDKISKIYTKKDKHCFELSGDTQHKLILKFWDKKIAEGFYKDINDIMNLYKKHSAKLKKPLIVNQCSYEITLKK